MKQRSLIARRATIAALGLVAATGFLATASIAQPPAGGGGGGFGGGGRRGGGQRGGGFGAATLANTPASTLAYGLKLSDEQKTKIEAAQKPAMDAQKSMMASFQGGGGQRPDQETMRANFEKVRTAQTQAETDVEAILTPDQKAAAPAFLKKLTALQQAGIPAGVYGDLKLTDTQETQITDISEKAQRKMREARDAAQASGEQMDRQAMMTMMQDTRTKVEGVLTPEQKSKLDEYNKAHPQRGFGGGGFGGGGGRRGGGGGAPAGGGGGNL